MRAFSYLLSIPKSLYFNLRYFGLRGLTLPVLISHRTRLRKLEGRIHLPEKTKTAGIRIGFGNVPIFDEKRSRTIFSNQGTIYFKGRAKIGHGGKVVVQKNACLTIGDHFNMSAESTIYCCHKITFGDYNLLSWQAQFLDSDQHEIYAKNSQEIAINPPAEIITGDSVWFCSRTNVVKGVTIPSNCIIAANSNVAKTLTESFCIYGGNPAKVIKRNVCWDSIERRQNQEEISTDQIQEEALKKTFKDRVSNSK